MRVVGRSAIGTKMRMSPGDGRRVCTAWGGDRSVVACCFARTGRCGLSQWTGQAVCSQERGEHVGL